MKKILILSNLLLITWIGFSQNIFSNIYVNIAKREIASDTMPIFFKVQFEQHIHFDNIQQDTVILTLENVHPWGVVIPNITFPMLKLFVKSSQDDDYQKTNSTFNGQQLAFAVPSSNFQAKIVYENSAFTILKKQTKFFIKLYLCRR